MIHKPNFFKNQKCEIQIFYKDHEIKEQTCSNENVCKFLAKKFLKTSYHNQDFEFCVCNFSYLSRCLK